MNLSTAASDALMSDLELPLLSADEIYGGKLVAALDRQHPRDLFDVSELFAHGGITPGIRRAFIVYLASHNRTIHEVLFPTPKDIRERTGDGPAEITPVMAQFNALLDRSIAADGFFLREDSGEGGRHKAIDLSSIDFEALSKRFATTTRKNVELEQFRAAVRKQLNTLVRANPTRADFSTKFEELIESYNAGSRNIDDLFRELLALSRSLSDEEQRHVREQLTEEELTVFDLLTRPGPDLAPAERDEVKKVARHLLDQVRRALVLNWREKAQARAQVKLTIEDVLDEGLPRA